MESPHKVIEIIGEGKTDYGKERNPDQPQTGVVPILVQTLCGQPTNMRVKRRSISFLHRKKGLWQKVKFEKRQAFYNGYAGVVLVLDTEGDYKQKINDLKKGRDDSLKKFPMAVGVAHPCIETWLLADARAIKKGLNLAANPELPEKPEELPAPKQNRKHNPKTVLAACAGATQAELSSAAKNQIAVAIEDITILRERCPLGFSPFAEEVEQRIKPLFTSPSAPA